MSPKLPLRSNDPPEGLAILRGGTFADSHRKYETAEELSEACVAYFKWVEENPLLETKAFSYEGHVTMHQIPRMRAATIRGMCLFIGITPQTWTGWRDEKKKWYRPDLAHVISAAEDMIHEQKFTGAASGLLNAQIISRDLGLAERTEMTGANGGPVEIRTLADFYRDAADAADAIDVVDAAASDADGS